MKIPVWLLKAIGAANTVGPFPPVMFCFIDGKRNNWIEKGVTFGCGEHVYHVPTGEVHPAPKEPKAEGEI